mgnify:CR=1 FL=1
MNVNIVSKLSYYRYLSWIKLMGVRQTMNTLLTFFVLCINAILFAGKVWRYSAAASFIYVEQNFDEIVGPNLPAPLPAFDMEFYNSMFNDQAIMYFVATGWTTFSCLYSLVTIPCGWKGQWARHGDFFITLIALCFQMAMAVMSSINTLIW